METSDCWAVVRGATAGAERDVSDVAVDMFSGPWLLGSRVALSLLSVTDEEDKVTDLSPVCLNPDLVKHPYSTLLTKI